MGGSGRQNVTPGAEPTSFASSACETSRVGRTLLQTLTKLVQRARGLQYNRAEFGCSLSVTLAHHGLSCSACQADISVRRSVRCCVAAMLLDSAPVSSWLHQRLKDRRLQALQQLQDVDRHIEPQSAELDFHFISSLALLHFCCQLTWLQHTPLHTPATLWQIRAAIKTFIHSLAGRVSHSVSGNPDSIAHWQRLSAVTHLAD
jgi:hypothetical protein